VIVNLAVNARDAMPMAQADGTDRNVTSEDSARLSYKGMRWRTMCGSMLRIPAPGLPRDRRQDLRAVLLDQGSRQGHRARPVDVYGIVKQTGGFVYVDSETDKARVPYLSAAVPPELEVQPEAVARTAAPGSRRRRSPGDLTGRAPSCWLR